MSVQVQTIGGKRVALLKIRDMVTQKNHTINASYDVDYILTEDGIRVKLYPVSLRTLVKEGQTFDVQTANGPREFRLL